MKRRGFLKTLLGGSAAAATGALTANDLLINACIDNAEEEYKTNPSSFDGILQPTNYENKERLFDTVTYTGNGTAGEIPHNLGVNPCQVIYKRRDKVEDWQISNNLPENNEHVINVSKANTKGGEYIAYLFAEPSSV